MADMTHEKATHLDDVVIVTRKQLLAAEGLLGAIILATKTLTDDILSSILANFNQWLYHPDTIPKEFLDYSEVSKEEE